MTQASLSLHPITATIRESEFDLFAELCQALQQAELSVCEGDILAVSSKYAAISEGRVITLSEVVVGAEAQLLANRYGIQAQLAQLVWEEAEHVFGGIQLGFTLSAHHGIIAPNAGVDRSNIPSGKAVLLPRAPYALAAELCAALRNWAACDVGLVLTDSCLLPGRLGTAGIAVATAGFAPVQDERGRPDLFGNAMTVTQRGIADSLAAAAQLVMGERDEATPFTLIRGSHIPLCDRSIHPADVAIDWRDCIYVQSLTEGLLIAAPMTPLK
ncbi:MAG: coenzyme F420-0:L-glutamate ligase [Chloroflexi bacterium]|nr:coenzyme F420-0:L-glutamate ligase [Chloroflexota bacterium]